MSVEQVEQFDFESSLRQHPNVISVTEIDLKSLPSRMAHHRPELSRSFLATFHLGTLTYELIISEPKDFPKKLPYIHLASPEEYDFHNHVNFEGDICYTDKGAGVFIAVDQTDLVLHQALGMAVATIEQSAGRDLTSLHEEFEGYWSSLPGCKTVKCFFEPRELPEHIKAFCNPKAKQKQIPVAFYQKAIPKEYGYQSRLNKLQSVNAWYIPLSKSTLPPSPDSELTPSYVRRLLKYVQPTARNYLIDELTKQKKKKKGKMRYQREIFLFSQPRPYGKLALFGVVATGYSKNSFFGDSDQTVWQVIPLSIQRHYESYVLERGGAKLNLGNVTVAVIGCGAVGSRISEQLALCGVGHIIIIDNDKLSEDNIYRHVLGGGEIGDNKAEAMAKHLKWRLPFVDAIAKPTERDGWLKEGGWKTIQMIVDATADFTGMREMNQVIVRSPDSVPVLYCWLEACSIGGHALLVDGKSKGCLECLLDQKEQGPCRRSDFLMPFQNVTKDLTGCGGAFTPFSALDSIKTATLAAELALEKLINGQDNSYRYWLGASNLAENADLRTSAWYKNSVSKNIDNVEFEFMRSNCPVCGVHV